MANGFPGTITKAAHKAARLENLMLKSANWLWAKGFLSQELKTGDIFQQKCTWMSPSEHRAMACEKNTDVSLTRQCKRLKISRSSIHYTPVGVDQATIDLMHKRGVFS